jgi:hypothetical protein
MATNVFCLNPPGCIHPIPVYMYSISFQLISVFLKLIITFPASSHLWTDYPLLKRLLSPICWPVHLTDTLFHLDQQDASFQVSDSIQLIKPHRIISSATNNLMILLSFGLCSPVLGCSITLSVCLALWRWQFLIGRCVSHRQEATSSCPPSIRTTLNHLHLEQNTTCDLSEKHEDSLISSHSTASLRESSVAADPFLNLLESQLQGTSSSLVVCKWPIICTSCVFITLLCWDMVADEVGWENSLWMPVAGVSMLLIVWIWDRWVVSRVINFASRHNSLSRFFSFPHPLSSTDGLELAPSLPVHPSLFFSSSLASADGKGGEED